MGKIEGDEPTWIVPSSVGVGKGASGPGRPETMIMCTSRSASRPLICLVRYNACFPLRNSATFSPMITQGAIVFPVVTRGMIEPSAMRKLSMP